MAFYALVSLPPAIAITLQLAGFTLDPTAVRDALMSQIQMVWGADAAATTNAIAHYAIRSRANSWGTMFAIILSVVTASTLFVEMRRSLDVIWGEGSDGIVRSFLKSRLVAFGALIVLGVALWASVLVSALLAAADVRYLSLLGISPMTIVMIGNGIAGAVIFILLALLYKLLPQERVTWVEAWCGAFVVTCLYLVGKEAIAFYLGSATIAPAFGGGIAGTLIVLLLWFYYSAQIFLFGAELSHEIALERAAKSAGTLGRS